MRPQMSTAPVVTSPSLNDAEEFVPPGLEIDHDTSTCGLSSATLKSEAGFGVSAEEILPPILEAQGS